MVEEHKVMSRIRPRLWRLGLSLAVLIVVVAGLVASLRPAPVEAQRVPPGGAPRRGSGAFDLDGNVRVIDGNTIEALVDGQRTAIGLVGVDVAPGNTACGMRATGRMWGLTKGGLRLEEDLSEPAFDARGRRLYQVKTRDGKALAEELVASGLGKASGKGEARDRLREVESAARGARPGAAPWRRGVENAPRVLSPDLAAMQAPAPAAPAAPGRVRP